MFTFFISGGLMMWPIFIMALVIVVISIKKSIDIFQRKQSREEIEEGIHSILFWGALSALLGFFSHYLGVYLAMQAIMKANDISPGIVAHGYQMSIIPILSGLTVLIVSAFAWMLLKALIKRMDT